MFGVKARSDHPSKGLALLSLPPTPTAFRNGFNHYISKQHRKPKIPQF